MTLCATCGTQLTSGAKFCAECGTRVDAAAANAGESRRVVTILFSDVAGSTALGERLDPEAVRSLMGRYFAAMQTVIERHGGTVEKFVGDAVMAVFGIPDLHEDDALRAVRAAAGMREALAALNEELSNERGVAIETRTGITTGEVVAGDPSAGQTLVTGDTVNTAARLEQAAEPGEILIGDPTWRLVRDAVSADPVEAVSAKGKALPVPAYRLGTVAAGAEGHARRLDAPLVGRERELARVQQAYRDAVEQRSPQLFTLLGAAGVGKSRLVREFLAGVGDEARIIRGRCLPYGEGITYWPLAEALREAAGIIDTDDRAAAQAKVAALVEGEPDSEAVAARLATAIGLSDEAAEQNDVFWAVRTTFEHMARERPLVVLFEDIHWAEPSFLDLLDHLAEWSRNVPLFLLAPARPELLDGRASWAGGKLNATTVLLEGLPGEALGRLIDAFPGGAALPESLRTRIAATSEGNALFVEELLGMLVDDGVLRHAGGGWEADNVGDLAIPGTIQALLAARLDRLSAAERRVAQRASVVGRVFERDAVIALSEVASGVEVNDHLMAMVRKELVRPDRSPVTGGDAYKFRHILLRDAAYGGIPKRARASLHERCADWIESTAGDRLAEVGEVIAYHLEQATTYHRDLGGDPLAAAEVMSRATRVLCDAGRRAIERGDEHAGIDLLLRAKSIDGNDDALLPAMPLLATALGHHGRLTESTAIADECIERATATGMDGLAAWARVDRVWLRSRLDPDWHIKAEREAEHALPILGALDDHLGQARVWSVLSDVWGNRGQGARAFEAGQRALQHAEAAGDGREISRMRGNIVVPLFGGPMPADEVVGWCTSALEDPALGRFNSVLPQLVLSRYAAALGDIGRGGEALAAARRILDESEWLFGRLMACWCATWLAEVAGDWALLEQEAHAGLALARSQDDAAFQATFTRELASLALTRGDWPQAEALGTAAARVAPPNDIYNMAECRLVLMVVAAHHNDRRRVCELAVEARAIADETDDLVLHADVERGIAFAAAVMEDADAARAHARHALEIYQSKGWKYRATEMERLIDNHGA